MFEILYNPFVAWFLGMIMLVMILMMLQDEYRKEKRMRGKK